MSEEPTGGLPLIEMDRSTGEYMIAWPEGRPEQLLITSDEYERMLGTHNGMVQLCNLQAAALANYGTGKPPPRRMLRDIEHLKRMMGLP
jgi:hypothetical protein